jgi:hypothetical protein
MGLPKLIVFMLNLVRTSTQTALDRFFGLIGEPQTHMTQQSFSEARQKLRPEACRELMEFSGEQVYTCDVDTWHSMLVVAIDGSKIQLPDNKDLLDTFGGVGRNASSPTAQASFAYDILNGLVIDAQIEPLAVDERTLALRHVQRIKEIPNLPGALLLFDRGYPSFDLMGSLHCDGLKFLMRLRSKFNLDIDSLGHGVHKYALRKGDNAIALRVIKFTLPGGKTETLITNLTDARMGIKAFKQLYALRWGIETKYGEVKLKLELENFSGYTETAIRQDFYITVTLANLVSVAAHEAQPVIDLAHEGKDNKHQYKVNINHTIGSFKDSFILALLDCSPKRRAKKVDDIIHLICYHAVPERHGRSLPRNPSPRKSRFHHNLKSNC